MVEPEFHSYSPQHSQETNHPTSQWDHIPTELTGLIFSYLPIPSIIRGSSVCKLWNSIVYSGSFKTWMSNSRARLPWLFFFPNHTSHQAFAFDPVSNCWIQLPNRLAVITNEKFSSEKVLTWCSRTGPWICDRSKQGYCCVSGCLDVYIQNVNNGYFEHCSLPPEISGLGILCSTLFKGKLYYIFDRYSGFVSCFDLETRIWNDVRTLRPPGMVSGYLTSCGDRLVLAGLVWSINYDDEFEFILWRVDEYTFEFGEIGIMPRDSLLGFLEAKEISSKIPRLMKCVGSKDVVYVFDEEQCGSWDRKSSCVFCEISDSGECRWKKVPNLPEPLKAILDERVMVSTVCSTVSLLDILGK